MAVAAVIHRMVSWAEGQWRWREVDNFWRPGDSCDEETGKGETKDTSWVRRNLLTGEKPS